MPRWVLLSLLSVAVGAGCTSLNGQTGAIDSLARVEGGNPPVLEGQASPEDGRVSGEQAFASPAGLPTGVAVIGDQTFNIEIAATTDAQARGLMGRESLAPDAGMLFVFDRPQRLSFWMRNTLIPLDIAFIRTDGTIESIDTMAPLTLNSHRSGEPVPLALEVPAGTFERLGIAPGSRVTISEND